MSDYSVRIKAVLDTSGARRQIASLGKNAKINIDNSGIKQTGKELDGLAKKANRTFTGAAKASQGVSKGFSGIIPTLKKGADGFVDITKKVALFGASTAVIRGISDGIGSMITSVTELDSSLTELQKVTDLEGQALKEFTEQAYEAGKGVAKTGTEIVDAATEFAKAGYDDQALQLAEVATMYQNIADEQVSAADSATLIISLLKAFKKEGLEAIDVIDRINEV